MAPRIEGAPLLSGPLASGLPDLVAHHLAASPGDGAGLARAFGSAEAFRASVHTLGAGGEGVA
ncbi:hypothetical protein ACIQM3_26390 [Streptomyces sp. NPDC091271]|uniref:hypothetical protein n=1 Tax=Streptomyces sp. NPDC091271 TaxID=3365980 RepID=UPI00380BEB6B